MTSTREGQGKRDKGAACHEPSDDDIDDDDDDEDDAAADDDAA
jgi:hypothetical protein